MRKRKKSIENDFYTLDRIDATGATYRIIIGERARGKTYALKIKALKSYWKDGSQTAYIRRFREDFIGKIGSSMFDDVIANGEIEKITNGEWSGVYYRASKWYLSKNADGSGKLIVDDKPFMYGIAISSQEHEKSGGGFPGVKIIYFDECLTATGYLTDEFMLFMHTLSTVIRLKDDVIIYMLGNTFTKYSPYFTEMGLSNIKNQEAGTIDLYRYGNSILTVAVEITGSSATEKKSNKYFAFNNPKLTMITGGNSIWELGIYPHAPMKWRPADVVFTYIIKFNDEVLQADIVQCGISAFTFIHRKTTPIQDENRDIIYTPDFDPRPNWKRKITRANNELDRKIGSFFVRDKVFYQDNEVGDIVNNYIRWCHEN